MKKILAPLLLLCTVSAHAQESKVVLPVKTVYLNRMFDLATIEGREVSIEYDRTAPGKLWIAFHGMPMKVRLPTRSPLR